MSRQPNTVDLATTLAGDLIIGVDGDLKLWTGYSWLIGEINKVVRTAPGDWESHPTYGAGVEGFRGEENTAKTAKAMERQITDAIVAAQIITPPDYPSVQVVPVGLNEVIVYVNVVSVGISIDLMKLIVNYDKGVSVAIEEAQEDLPVPETSRFTKNKYLQRLKR